MAAEELWTFTDLVDRVLDNFGEYAKDGRNHRVAREAVREAYRRLPSLHAWAYYKRRHIFTTTPSQGTGTLAFDFSGYPLGELAFVLSGANWPEDAALGAVMINDNHWPIVERVSGAVALGMPGKSPLSDISSGASYEWYREAYPIPVRTRRVGELLDSDGFTYLTYAPPESSLIIARRRTGPIDRPSCYTIRNDDRYMNTLSVVLSPPPSSARTYEYLEQIGGQPLVEEKVTGTVSVSGTLVTATTPIFSDTKHVGCVIRIAADGDTIEPTSLRGNLGTYNPATTSRIIQAVNSDTVAIMDYQAEDSHAASLCVISSPVDVETDSMLSLLFAMCDMEFVSRSNDFNIAERNYRRGLMQEYLAFAMEADQRSTEVQTAHPRSCYIDSWLPVGRVTTHLG